MSPAFVTWFVLLGAGVIFLAPVVAIVWSLWALFRAMVRP